MKNLEDAKDWTLVMRKFFELHDYTNNMKAKITIFNLKGKTYIWWEDAMWVREIKTNDLNWQEFKSLFKKKYLSKRYYNNKAK